MMLKNKVVVIYGAGGAIGGAVARAFAREGASVFLTGRTRMSVAAVATEINAAGGSAEAAEVDALDGSAVAEHLATVVAQTSRIDVSFNAVGFPNARTLGVPLVEQELEKFVRPIAAYASSYFLTATLAARRMLAQKSGVIMTVTALPARLGFPLNGGYGPAMAAKEAMTRCLSGELAPHGIRVVSLRPHGLPETRTMRDVFELKGRAAKMTWEQFLGYLASTTHAGRGSTLAELANAAAFLASDLASGLTGTNVNLSLGSLDD